MKERNNIVISDIWFERFRECSRNFGTHAYTGSVLRFYNSLLDINNEDLAIYSKVSDYKKNVFDVMINDIVTRNTVFTSDSNVVETEYNVAVDKNIVLLFRMIIQTIQDSGIGWHTNSGFEGFHIKQD